MDLSEYDLEKALRENEAKFAESREERKQIERLEILERYDGEDKVMPFAEVVAQIKAKRGDGTDVLYTKIPRIDYMTDGFRPGQVIVITAPTGEGKTALCQSFTRTFTEQGANCLWLSYEVPPDELEYRFEGFTPAFHIPRMHKSGSLLWLQERIMEGIAKYGTNVVFIDHLHYLLDLKMLALARGNTSLVIGVLMRELKKLAISTNTIIFLVSHLAKTKLDKAPTKEDLRDSSFVSQESDIVMVLWRGREPRKKGQDIVYTNEAKVLIDKNRRNGRMGYANLIYNKGRFTEIDTHHAES